jgi:hypothetical protein
MNPNTRNNLRKYGAAIIAPIAMFAVSAHAVLPTYMSSAIDDSKTQLTELVGLMVPAAIFLVLLALGPRVLLKMIRGLGSKVSF